MEIILYWILVIVFIPGLIGSFITKLIDWFIKEDLNKKEEERKWTRDENYEKAKERVPWQPFVLGLIERTMFCIYLGAYSLVELPTYEKVVIPQGVFIGALSWIALKLAIGWRVIVGIEAWRRMLAVNALINSIISISIGLFGGLIIKNSYFFKFLNERLIKPGEGIFVLIIVMVVSVVILTIYKYFPLSYPDKD
jgi:hypothetical protein